MNKVPVTKDPVDVYAYTGIAPGTCLEIQNKTTRDIMIWTGSAAPAELDEYFILRPYKWHKHSGDVFLLYAGLPTYVVVKESC